MRRFDKRKYSNFYLGTTSLKIMFTSLFFQKLAWVLFYTISLTVLKRVMVRKFLMVRTQIEKHEPLIL